MPNIAAALKAEISRIARKEAKSETEDFKKASSQYRTHIAALRRRIDALERAVKKAAKSPASAAPADTDKGSPAVLRRFSATRLAATRKKMGLSAADFGTLIGKRPGITPLSAAA